MSRALRVPNTAEVQAFIASDPLLLALMDRLAPRLQDGDDAHGISHLLRVARWTLALAPADVPPRLSIAAALLHDLINRRKDDPQRSLASAESASLGDQWLAELGMPAEERTLIHDAILNHSASRGQSPMSRFGQALQDADRLDTLGVTALLRAALTSGRMGRDLACAEDPWAQQRAPEPMRYALDYLIHSVVPRVTHLRHPAARVEALARLETLLDSLETLGQEWGVPMPLAIRQQIADALQRLQSRAQRSAASTGEHPGVLPESDTPEDGGTGRATARHRHLLR